MSNIDIIKSKFNKIWKVPTYNTTQYVEIKEEENGGQYSCHVSLLNKSEYIVVLPEKMKELTTYINTGQRPKDCDAIIIDETRSIAYFLELKSLSATSTQEDVKKQLDAGEKWFDHLLFIIGEDKNRYKRVRIRCNINARNKIPTRLDRDLQTCGHYIVMGTRLILSRYV